MRPGICRIRCAVDRDIPEDLDAPRRRVGTKRRPLLVKLILYEGVERHLVRMLRTERSHRLRIAVPQRLRPDIPARAGKRILDCHEDAVLDGLRTKLREKPLDVAAQLLEMRKGKLQRLILAAVEPPIVDAFNAVDRHTCLLPYISRLLQPATKVAERQILTLLLILSDLGTGECCIVDRITEIKFLRIRELLCAQQSLLDQQVEVHEIRISREGRKRLVRRIAEARRAHRQDLPDLISGLT